LLHLRSQCSVLYRRIPNMRILLPPPGASRSIHAGICGQATIFAPASLHSVCRSLVPPSLHACATSCTPIVYREFVRL
jgi:hypothetical protein